jgi:hypothetical protein
MKRRPYILKTTFLRKDTHVIAVVGEYNQVNTLFALGPISVEVR